MTIDSLLAKHRKSIRKLIHLWPGLINPKNFLVPETLDEYAQFGFLAPKIEINNAECFFNEKSKNDLSDFIDTLHRIEGIREAISYNSVYKTTIFFIGNAVMNQIKHSIKPNSKKDIEDIIKVLFQKRSSYQFLRIVEGVRFDGIGSLVLGNVEVFVFTEKHEEEFQGYREKNNLNVFLDGTVEPFIKRHFTNKICVRATAIGDEAKAEEIAMKQINQGINMLRFMICLLAEGKIIDTIRINLLAESHNASENTLSINLATKQISLGYGRSRKPLQAFPIDPKRLDDLRGTCFFNDWGVVLSKDHKTELEEAILTAIYWIGEAQNDFCYESAFIKYWIALETLFTLSKENITKSLSKGISVLLAFGGYQFIETREVDALFKNVEELYDKRSKVVHRGVSEEVTPIELENVCKYAVWCVLTCFGLRFLGYETLDQIRDETNRLSELGKPNEPQTLSKGESALGRIVFW